LNNQYLQTKNVLQKNIFFVSMSDEEKKKPRKNEAGGKTREYTFWTTPARNGDVTPVKPFFFSQNFLAKMLSNANQTSPPLLPSGSQHL